MSDSGRYIPPELWAKIMLLLPSKSLLSFRSLSKSNLSMIDDPDFIFSHLHNLPSNTHQTLTLVHTHTYGHYEIRDPCTSSTLRAPLNPLSLPLNARILASSLDGLVLLTSPDEPSFILWNPSTTKTRTVPLPTPLSHSNPTPNVITDYFTSGSRLAALAYDSPSRDYKVLYITYEYVLRVESEKESVPLLGVWVYSIKARSWTALSAEGSGICALRDWSNCHAQSVFFQGAVFWIESWYSEANEYSIRMVRFELGIHRFQYYYDLPLPAVKHKKMESRVVILDGGKTLGLCGVDAHDFVCVWSWDGEAGSWIEYCLVSEFPLPSIVNGAFLHLYKYEELSWKYRASDGTRKIFTYNLRTGHMFEGNASCCVFYEPNSCAYIQSLVHP